MSNKPVGQVEEQLGVGRVVKREHAVGRFVELSSLADDQLAAFADRQGRRAVAVDESFALDETAANREATRGFLIAG